MRSAAFNICVGLAAGALLMAARPAEAISVDIEGLPASVTAGEEFTVDIVVTGIVDEIISAWDIDLAFDAALLENSNGTILFPGPWGDLEDDTIYDFAFADGSTDAWLVSLLSDAELLDIQCPAGACGATLVLARLGFTALADGAPEISLVDWGPLNDIKCEENRQCYPVDEPPPMPEPGTLALLSLGMLGMGLARRRRSA